jgi:hypothetical protein
MGRPRVVQLTLPRRYWQTRWARPRIPCHPGRVTKSLFATSSGVPERHEDVISDGGFPRPPPPPPPRPRLYSFKSRSHREARSISRRAAPVQAKPGASFVSGSHLQAGRGAARRGAGVGGGRGRRRATKEDKQRRKIGMSCRSATTRPTDEEEVFFRKAAFRDSPRPEERGACNCAQE